MQNLQIERLGLRGPHQLSMSRETYLARNLPPAGHLHSASVTIVTFHTPFLRCQCSRPAALQLLLQTSHPAWPDCPALHKATLCRCPAPLFNRTCLSQTSIAICFPQLLSRHLCASNTSPDVQDADLETCMSGRPRCWNPFLEMHNPCVPLRCRSGNNANTRGLL